MREGEGPASRPEEDSRPGVEGAVGAVVTVTGTRCVVLGRPKRLNVGLTDFGIASEDA